MATSHLSVIKPLDLTKESRLALIQYISILRGPNGVHNWMPTPERLRESMGDRFGEILYIEEFLAGGKQGLFVTFASPASRNDFIAFTKKLKDRNDPLFTIRGTDRSVDAFSLLPRYNIPSSLEKILKIKPEVSSKNLRSGTRSAIPTAPRSFATKKTALGRDSVTGGAPSAPSFLGLPSRPDTGTSSLEAKAATEITRDNTISSTSTSNMRTGYQIPSSSSDSQTWGWKSAPEGFELDNGSVHSGICNPKSVATAQDISLHRAAPQTSVASVWTSRPSNTFSPTLPPIPTTVESLTAHPNVQNPKVKVEGSLPDKPKSQNPAKDGATDLSYLDVCSARAALKISQRELQGTQWKLSEAKIKLNEIRSQAAIDKTRLAEEEMKRKAAEKKIKGLQDEVKALSSCKRGEAKCSEVEVQTLPLTTPQESIQMGQKWPMEHASTQTEIESPDPPGDTMELEEPRQGGMENDDQLKLARAKGLEENEGGMEVLGAEGDSELKRHRLVHEQNAEFSAELERLRSKQRESEDALQRQCKDHAEQLAELRGEMEMRKIEALAAQFPAASKLLIAAYIRLESLGKRKREDDEEDI